MGISIAYQGSLSDSSRLEEALSDVRNFATRVRWRCDDFSEHYSGVVLVTQAEADGDSGTRLKDPNPEPWPETTEKYGLSARVSKRHPPRLIEETVRGVFVTPPDTESLRLAFDSNGRLTKYWDIPAELVINAIPDTNHYIAFHHFVGTSGAPASHAALCLLLRMLKQKYMKNLQVSDSTGFWKTANLERLKLDHAQMSTLLGLFGGSKDLSALLRTIGLNVPEGSEVTQLSARLTTPVHNAGPKKTPVN
jgi:hypothetical protein